MRVEIFDVEHGFCALVTGRSGERVLIDCGHNSVTGWRPSNYLRRQPLDLLVITNYDQDHLSDFYGVWSKIGFRWLSSNFSLAPPALATLKRQQGPLSPEMKALVDVLGGLGPIVPLRLPSIRWGAFCIPFPNWSPAETNKHSLVVFMEADGINIVFPGDLPEEGWEELLSGPEFRECLKRTNIFVTSHHGREDGFCKEVFNYCSPDIVVISDGPIQFDTQRGMDYSQYAKGITIRGDTYYTLTTRRFGKLTIESSIAGFTVSASKGMTDNISPILRALLSHSSPNRIPPASSLLGFGSTAEAVRSLDPTTRPPTLLDLPPPIQKPSILHLLAPPAPKPPASLLSQPQEDSPIARLLTELLKNRKKS